MSAYGAAATGAAGGSGDVFENHAHLKMTLSTLRVAELQSLCRDSRSWGGGSLRAVGKKADLVDRLFAAADLLQQVRTPANTENYRRFKQLMNQLREKMHISRGWQATPVASTSYNSTPAGGTYPTAGASTSTTSGWPNPGAAPYAPQGPSGTGYRPPTFGPGSVAGAGAPGTSHVPGGAYNGASTSTSSYRPPGASSSYAGAHSSAGSSAAAAGPAKSAVAFHLKSTPFYHIRKFVGVPAKIPRAPYERKTQILQFVLSDAEAQTLKEPNPTHGLRLVCTPWENHQACSPTHPAQIEFPSQADMRVNGQIHAYAFRGPKKYPGRVMPPDITDKVLLTPNARNRVEFVYSGSVKEYVLTVAYCERVSIESLVASLDNKVLSKEKVIAQRKKAAEDDEIEAGDAQISLKCPLSLRKLDRPARSSKCDHMQCFDPRTFLLSNELTPNWQCPVCANTIAWEEVVIDGFIQEIVKGVGKDIDTVIVKADGSWAVKGQDAIAVDFDASPVKSEAYDGESRQKSEVYSIDDSPPQHNRVAALGANGSSRSGSAAHGSGRSTPSKTVIDLTLSDSEDEDEATPAPAVVVRPPEQRKSPPRPTTNGASETNKRPGSPLTAEADKRFRDDERPLQRTTSARLADGSEVSEEYLSQFLAGRDASPSSPY